MRVVRACDCTGAQWHAQWTALSPTPRSLSCCMMVMMMSDNTFELDGVKEREWDGEKEGELRGPG